MTWPVGISARTARNTVEWMLNRSPMRESLKSPESNDEMNAIPAMTQSAQSEYEIPMVITPDRNTERL